MNKIPTIFYTLAIYGTVGAAFLLWSPFPAEAYQIAPAIYLYLLLALVLWTIGLWFGGRFVKPRWNLIGKLIRYILVSYLLLVWLGHWALIYIVIDPLIGLVFHIYICKKYDINWRTIEPRERYLALMEKWGRGDFSPL